MIVSLTEDEILTMLKQFPDIWMEALRRGKGVHRLDVGMERKGK
jgi:hypothetical protein